MVSQELWGEFERTGSISAYLNYVLNNHNGYTCHMKCQDGSEELSATCQTTEEESAQNEGRNYSDGNCSFRYADRRI